MSVDLVHDPRIGVGTRRAATLTIVSKDGAYSRVVIGMLARTDRVVVGGGPSCAQAGR